MADNKFIAPADVDVQLQNTAKTYRSQLITMPTKGLAQSLKYMTLRPGIRVSETVGELLGNAELGPYDENRVGDGGVKITPRTLQVYLGNVDIKFSPNSVYSTIWGANAMNGEALKNVPITLQVLQLLALKMGKNLNLHLFDAVRNDQGKGSKDLFNGFDTIAKTELTNAKLSSELGNLIKVSDILGSDASISDDNAVDFAQAICESADEELIGEEKLYLYVPQAFINLYNRKYLKKFGNVPYNKGYNHNTIEGFATTCSWVSTRQTTATRRRSAWRSTTLGSSTSSPPSSSAASTRASTKSAFLSSPTMVPHRSSRRLRSQRLQATLPVATQWIRLQATLTMRARSKVSPYYI